MRTFQTGGPGGTSGFVEDVVFARLDRDAEALSPGLLRFNNVSKAFVCACCRVGGGACAC